MPDALGSAIASRHLTLAAWNDIASCTRDPATAVTALLKANVVIDKDAMEAIGKEVDLPKLKAQVAPPPPKVKTTEGDYNRLTLYRGMHERAKKELLVLYTGGLRTLESLGITPGADKEMGNKAGAFTEKLLKLRDTLKESPQGKEVFTQTLAAMGCSDKDVVDLLWNKPPEAKRSYETIKTCWQIFEGGVRLSERLTKRRAEVAAPFDQKHGAEQTFKLLADFPALADKLYQEKGFEQLQGFPPEAKEFPERSDEQAFLKDAQSWQTSEQRWQYAEMAGLLVAGIAITAATGGAGGAAVGVAAGAVFGVGVSSAQVLKASEELQKAKDGAVVGAVDAGTVHYKENELIAAYGGLIVNVVTLGVGAKIGAGTLAAAGFKELAKQGVQAVALGAGSAAATTMTNPNVWEAPDTLALIAQATIVGAVSGGVGAGIGIGASKISIGIPRGAGAIKAGTKIEIGAEGKPPMSGTIRRLVAGSDEAVIDVSGKEVKVKLGELRAVKGSKEVVDELRAKGKGGSAKGKGVEEHGFLDYDPAKLPIGSEIELCAVKGTVRGKIVGYKDDQVLIETDVHNNGFTQTTEHAMSDLTIHDLGDGGPIRVARPGALGRLMQARDTTPVHDAGTQKLSGGNYAIRKPNDPSSAPDHTSPLTFRPRGKLDPDEVFETDSVQRPGTKMVGKDGKPKTSFDDVAVFEGHGAPGEIQELGNKEIVAMMVKQIREYNSNPPPGRAPLEYLLLDSCHQGDPGKVFGLFGKTNAQTLQKMLDKEFGEGVITVLAADRPGALMGGDLVEVAPGRYEKVTFVPAREQSTVQHLSTGKKAARAGIIAGAGGVAAGATEAITNDD